MKYNLGFRAKQSKCTEKRHIGGQSVEQKVTRTLTQLATYEIPASEQSFVLKCHDGNPEVDANGSGSHPVIAKRIRLLCGEPVFNSGKLA
jgi:hypothetical protein